MENNRGQQSRDLQRVRRTQNARNWRENMSTEQRQQELSRRRTNYRQSKERGKQPQTTSETNRDHMMLFNDLTNLNFTSSRVQGTHDNEAGTSSRRRINHTTSGYFQGTNDNEAGPSRRNSDDTTSETPTSNVVSDTTPNDAISYYNQELDTQRNKNRVEKRNRDTSNYPGSFHKSEVVQSPLHFQGDFH
ncbi:hypothetical protein MTR_5g083680 [Medicago truncatula]|uniref:Uncharacterized protein n=1 Tax=Medicago truncatula TaxID=3880 RepID=G7K7A9_MEDTR|nr:hypothetical protein MTR_5g083680 [Medicago truncatula]